MILFLRKRSDMGLGFKITQYNILEVRKTELKYAILTLECVTPWSPLKMSWEIIENMGYPDL